MITINVKMIPNSNGQLPRYMTNGAAGADLFAAIENPKTLRPGERMLVPTGLKFEIPVGYEVQVRPRSGLALSQGVTVLNSPGTIDSDYRGEVGVMLINLGDEEVTIEPGMRIAQAVAAPVVIANYVEVNEIGETKRGGGGFGHTGEKI